MQSLEAILQCLSVLSLCLIDDGRVESHVIVAMLAVNRSIAANDRGSYVPIFCVTSARPERSGCC